MKLPNLYILAVLLMGLTVACDKDTKTDPQASDKGKVLITNPWRLVNVTDASGKAIPSNQLNIETQAIYLFRYSVF